MRYPQHTILCFRHDGCQGSGGSQHRPAPCYIGQACTLLTRLQALTHPKIYILGLFTSAVSICCYYFCGTLKGENLQLFYSVFKYKHNKSPSEANQICFYLEMFILFWVILYGMILFHWLKFTLTSVSPQNGSRHSRDFCHFSFSLDRSPFLMFCRIHGCRSWSMRRESGKWQRNLFSWFSQHLSLRRQNVRSSRSWVQPMRCLRHSSCDG